MHRRAMHGVYACANACGRQAITFKVNDEVSTARKSILTHV